ncbi:MAG TPA: hypothetical protein PKN50_09940 [Spirochaetota bacterium]|nr:hypothetical protein [Spirochaetota bacterium]HPV43432.1 hypothetical protein [Spirochaetota bacterium]
MKSILVIIVFLMAASSVHAARFEELDKPPEGAHKGQMLLGAFATIGVPYGTIINAENNYIRNSTYTFLSNLITKKIMLQHLFFSYGIFYEYMPVDYLGIKVKGRRSSVVQRSQFGSEYQNWTKMLYSDFSFFLGPAVHFTSRRAWDISLTPLVGYALGRYTATPIAAQLIYSYDIPTEFQYFYFYTARRKKRTNNIVVGAELNISMFFTGGFLLSFGCDWNMNMLKFNSKFYISNIQNFSWFFQNKNNSNMHSVCFMLSAGYAFSN